MVLIDTSSWIESLRKAGDPAVQARVRGLLLSGEAAWCDVVRLELWNGAAGDAERRALKRFERDLPCLETTQSVWDLSCDFARRLRTAGVTVPSTDIIVLACARHHGAGLEHSDRHFDEARVVLDMRIP